MMRLDRIRAFHKDIWRIWCMVSQGERLHLNIDARFLQTVIMGDETIHHKGAFHMLPINQ